MPAQRTIGRAVGAAYLRAVLHADTDAITTYHRTYPEQELLGALSGVAVSLLLRCARNVEMDPFAYADTLVQAAVLRDEVEA